MINNVVSEIKKEWNGMKNIVRVFMSFVLVLTLVFGSVCVVQADDPKEPFNHLIEVENGEVHYREGNVKKDFVEGTDPYKLDEGTPTLTTDLDIALTNATGENSALYLYSGNPSLPLVNQPAHFTVNGDVTITEQHENVNAAEKGTHAIHLYSLRNEGEMGVTVNNVKVSVTAAGNRVSDNYGDVESANASALWLQGASGRIYKFEGANITAEATATGTGTKAKANASGINTWSFADVDDATITVNDISATAKAKTANGNYAEADAAAITFGQHTNNVNVHVVANNVTAKATAEETTPNSTSSSAAATAIDAQYNKGASKTMIFEVRGDVTASAESNSPYYAKATAIRANSEYTGTGENDTGVKTRVIVEGKAAASTTLANGDAMLTSGYNSMAVDASSGGEKAETYVELKKGAYGSVYATAADGGTTEIVIGANGINQDSWNRSLVTDTKTGGKVKVTAEGDIVSNYDLIHAENTGGTTEITVNAKQMKSQDGNISAYTAGENAETTLKLTGNIDANGEFSKGAVRLETKREEPASTVRLTAVINGDITAAGDIDPVAVYIDNKGGTVSADFTGNITSEDTAVIIGDPNPPTDAPPPGETMMYTSGDVKGSRRYGLMASVPEKQTADVVVEGTLSGKEASLVLMSDETILKDKTGQNGNMTMTVWKVVPNDDGAVAVRRKTDENTGFYIYEEDQTAEKAVQYIIRIRDAQDQYIDTNARIYETNGKSYRVANEGERVLVQLKIPEDQELTGAYWDVNQELSLLTDAEGNYYLDVQRGGGIELSVKMQPKQTEEDHLTNNTDKETPQEENKGEEDADSNSTTVIGPNQGTTKEANTDTNTDSNTNTDAGTKTEADNNTNNDAGTNANKDKNTDNITAPDTNSGTQKNASRPGAGTLKVLLIIVDTTETVKITFYSNGEYIAEGPDGKKESGTFRLENEQIVLMNNANHEMPITRNGEDWKLLFTTGKDATAYEFLIADKDAQILLRNIR